MSERNWFTARDGRQFGPLTEDELRRCVAESRLVPDDLVWRTDMPDWVPARQIAGLFPPESAGAPGAAPEPAADEEPSPEPFPAPRLGGARLGAARLRPRGATAGVRPVAGRLPMRPAESGLGQASLGLMIAGALLMVIALFVNGQTPPGETSTAGVVLNVLVFLAGGVGLILGFAALGQRNALKNFATIGLIGNVLVLSLNGIIVMVRGAMSAAETPPPVIKVPAKPKAGRS